MGVRLILLESWDKVFDIVDVILGFNQLLNKFILVLRLSPVELGMVPSVFDGTFV